ncbi:MAG: terminase large subunit domain-containing protein, partial [Waterburya sp.]
MIAEALDILNAGYNVKAELARRNLADFIAYTKPDYEFNWHHTYLCKILDRFAKGEIKKLMVFMPPQHGKSEIVSRRLPPFLLGRNPNLKIAGASYAHNLATKFNREVQRIMTSKEYSQVFSDTTLNEKRVATDAKGTWLRNSEMFEVVGKQGSYLSVGVGGGLTGNRVDVMIIDDPVKDAVQASSPAFQLRNIEWYESVVETRLHNDSQVIICMTRWDIDDLAGMILKREASEWAVVSMPALREDYADPNDPREIGEAMWSNRHSEEKILKVKAKSPKVYNSLYQQTPQAPDEILIFGKAMRVTEMPQAYERIMGIDFGFSNSDTAIVDIEIDRKRKIIWAKEVFYEVGASNSDIATVVKPYKLLTYCDSAEPK